jgi:diguanylate cyclase (GGDEF)-like protein
VNQDVTAAVDVLNSPTDVSSLTAGNASPDALAQLDEALSKFSSRVASRERELNRLFEEIAVERTSLLDAVLDRLFNGFSGVIPFDHVECAFLADDGKSTISYWARSSIGSAASTGQIGPHSQRLQAVLAAGRPRITNDLTAFVGGNDDVAFERRLLAAGAESALICPLVADGAPLGLLVFTSGRGNAFTDAHAAAFQRSAAQVSVVVQKTRAYGEVVNHNRMLIRETRRLREAATTDALTGVMNRRALDAALASSWDRYERDRSGFGLVICDVDHFKLVNDTYGHAVGDQVLAGVARCLTRGLRGADLFGRWGGEEFLAIIDTTSESTLGDVAERLRSLIARDSPCGIAVTASFGGAVSRRYATLGDLIVSADRALYSAKSRGRNQCVMATDADVVVPADADAASREGASSNHGD